MKQKQAVGQSLRTRSIECIFSNIDVDNNDDETTLADLTKKYVSLCREECAINLKKDVVDNQLRKFREENLKLTESLAQTRSVHTKVSEKVSRLTSLCEDLRRRCTGNANAISDEAREKRSSVNRRFDAEVCVVNKRIEDLTARKQAINDENERLRQQLAVVVEQMQSMEAEELVIAELESSLVEDDVVRLEELNSMSLEDHMSRMNETEQRKEKLREGISLFNAKFAEFQDRMKANNDILQGYRVKIDELNTAGDVGRKIKFDIDSEIKAVTRAIKKHAIVYEESNQRLEDERTKKEKIKKIIAAFEEDVRVKEAEIARLQELKLSET
jgi:chromosome segregation ATPase